MNKLTLLLVLTAAGLLLLLAELVLKDPRPSTMPSGNERGSVLHDFKADAVNSIKLSKGSVSIELVKKGAEWVMPLQKNRSAKDDRISKFLKDVEAAYSTGPRTAKDLAKFDLSPSTRTEVVMDGSAGKTTLYIGKNLNESGSFVQRDINGPVLEIDKYLPSALGIREEKSVTVLDPAFFYDLKIFGDSQDDAIDIAIKKGNEVTRIQKILPGKGPLEPNQKLDEKDKPVWWITEPEGAPADEGKVRNICSTVLNLTGKGYADDVAEKDRGFDKPSARIVIRLKDGAERSLTFGKIDNDDVLVSAVGKADAFKVAKYVYDTCTKTDELKQKEEKKDEAEKPAEKPAPLPIAPPKPAPENKAVPVIPAPNK